MTPGWVSLTLHTYMGLSITQVGPLRECQDIMGPASACLVFIWYPSGRIFRLLVFLVCIANCLRCGGLLQCQWCFIPAFQHSLWEEVLSHFLAWDWDPLVQWIHCCSSHSFFLRESLFCLRIDSIALRKALLDPGWPSTSQDDLFSSRMNLFYHLWLEG